MAYGKNPVLFGSGAQSAIVSVPMPRPPETSPSDATPRGADVRSAGTFSLLAGLCPLIPLPFIDDWAENVVRRRAVRDALADHGLEPTPGDVEILAGLEKEADPGGCLKRAILFPFVKIFYYVLKKMVRKIIYVLAVNDAAEVATSVLQEAWLLRRALAAGELATPPGGRLDRDAARRLRGAVDAAIADTTTAPIQRAVGKAFRGSRKVLMGAARTLGLWAKDERKQVGSGSEGKERAAGDLPVEEERRQLSGLVDGLISAVMMERDHLASLERRFDAELAARQAPPPPGIDASVGDQRV